MPNSIKRSICCDVIIVVTDYQRLVELLTKQACQPQWLNHTFVAVLNTNTTDEQRLSSWYYEARAKMPLPELIIIRPRLEKRESTPSMQNIGLQAGNNPFVYFHNERDNLPVNLDRAIFRLYNDPDMQVCIGRTEVFLSDGTPVEDFPMLNSDGEFIYDCERATHLFPSYIDPFSGVYRKKLFEKIPYYDEETRFKEFCYYHVLLKVLEYPEESIEFVPFTIKKAVRKQHNAGMIGPGLKARLIHDIKLWLPEHPDDEFKDFQMDILAMLENNDITTFKEIDARIEDYLDRHAQ